MRNLKRVLSLALAVVMVIGMMVMTTGAAEIKYEDLTDKAEIQNTEAVATLVSLGVVNGRNDGSFDPTGIVTRAEMAKMIAVCLNGGKDPLLGSNTTAAKFTDTKGHWAEPYIAYCSNLGIVDGYGDGTFNPDRAVSGTEAAKMFLTALGYRSDIEGLTGAGWDSNTDALANKAGLYDELNADVSLGLSRDNTAQLIYNGIQAYEVKYANLEGQYDGIIYANEQYTMLSYRFDVMKVSGIAVANERKSVLGYAVTKDGYGRMTVNNIDGMTNAAFEVAIPDEMIGQEIVVYVKFLNALSPNATGAVVLGDPILTDDNTIVETNGKIKDADALKDTLRKGGLAMPSDGDAAGVIYTEATPVVGDRDGHTGTGAGVAQRFIDNTGDGIVDLIIVNKPVLTKVTAVNTKGETITFAGATLGALDFADVMNDEDLAKGDYVLMTKYDDGNYYPVKATVEAKEVTAYTPNAFGPGNNAITAGGKYKDSALTDYSTDMTETSVNSGMIGKTYNLYLDNFGNMISAKQVSADVSNYAVVLAANTTGTTEVGVETKVKLLLADGSQKTFEVDLTNTAVMLGAANASDAPNVKIAAVVSAGGNYFDTSDATYGLGSSLENILVAYTLDEDNVVTLANPASLSSKYTKIANVDASQILNNSTATYTYNTTAGTLVADENTVFFIDNNTPANGYSVVTGLSNLPAAGLTMTASAGQAIYFQAAPGTAQVAKAVFVAITGDYTSASHYAYISGGYTQTTENGTNIYTYPVVFEDGTVGTLASKSNSIAKETIQKYVLDNKGYATFPADGLIKVGSRAEYTNAQTITLWNVDTDAFYAAFVLDGDTVVWDVTDTKNVFASEIAENDVVAVVIDVTTGAVQTAFIYDTMIGDMTNDVTVSGISASSTTLTYTPAAGQKVVIKVNNTKVAETEASDTPTAQTITLDSALASNDEVVVTISEDNKDTRTMTYTVS